MGCPNQLPFLHPPNFFGMRAELYSCTPGGTHDTDNSLGLSVALVTWAIRPSPAILPSFRFWNARIENRPLSIKRIPDPSARRSHYTRGLSWANPKLATSTKLQLERFSFYVLFVLSFLPQNLGDGARTRTGHCVFWRIVGCVSTRVAVCLILRNG
jgi:hypothetical protein